MRSRRTRRTIGTIAGSVRDNGSNVHLQVAGHGRASTRRPSRGLCWGSCSRCRRRPRTAGDNLEIVVERAHAVRRRRPADQGRAGLAARAGRGLPRTRSPVASRCASSTPPTSARRAYYGARGAVLLAPRSTTTHGGRHPAVPQRHEGVARGPGLRRPQQRADRGRSTRSRSRCGRPSARRRTRSAPSTARRRCTRTSRRTTRSATG